MAWPRLHEYRPRRKAFLNAKVAAALAIVLLIGFWALVLRWSSDEKHVDSPVETSQAWFVDRAQAVGIDFVHVSGTPPRYYFPEIMVGGVCLFDYDGDGLLDVYLVQSGNLDPDADSQPGNKLYRNVSDSGGLAFEDVSQAAGVADIGYGAGCACADYDHDGDIDLYVANVGPNVLYQNNGDGSFTDVTDRAGVGDAAWSQSAAFVDYDGDGWLDLMVVNYIRWSLRTDRRCFASGGDPGYCGPSNYRAPMPDTLYHNEGDGRFIDRTASAGLGEAFGNGLGVVCGDFNGDGLIDMYVANDGMPNQLWLNQGQGAFVDEALLAGCAVNMQGVSEAGMGVAAVDVDHDGDLDLFMSHLRGESNTFYVNANGWFEDRTAGMGLGGPSVDLTGFGLGFADFDHDGILDVYVANGRINLFEPVLDVDDVFAEPNQLFAGRDSLKFEEVMPPGGTDKELIATSRGAAFGDLDNDGDIDVVVINKDAAPYVLCNRSGQRGRWIMFAVLNQRGGHALEAVVRIEAGERVQTRKVQRAYSYGSSNDPRVHFGLGSIETVDRVTVCWPDGTQEAFGPFGAGKIYELRRSSGDPR